MASSSVMSAHVRAGTGMRSWLPTAATVTILLGAAGTALAMVQPTAEQRTAAPALVAPPSPGAVPAPARWPAAPSRSAAPAGPDLTALLSLPGTPPAKGSGRFEYAPGNGEVLGRSGRILRFRVAVERGSAVDVDAFAETVGETLGDERSWAGGGELRLQRVPAGADHDFTIYLATRTTAGTMCAAGGTDITVGGRPYTSCRATGKVIVNLDRWRLSSPRFTGSEVPLATYRQYVINHEVGHELGHGHQGCPGAGRPAPVMMQQTLRLLGCEPYAWPRRNGRAYAGPGV